MHNPRQPAHESPPVGIGAGLSMLMLASWLQAAGAGPGPSFSCDAVATGSIADRVCNDPELARLDRDLAAVYRDAMAHAGDTASAKLRAGQRGWVKGRDDCWKAADPRQCVEGAYRYRIAELQASYRLAPASSPITYHCDSDPGNPITVTFFNSTDPPTLIAVRGDSSSPMFHEPSASGSRYRGRNGSFWEHHGEALVTWGFDTEHMRCRKRP